MTNNPVRNQPVSCKSITDIVASCDLNGITRSGPWPIAPMCGRKSRPVHVSVPGRPRTGPSFRRANKHTLDQFMTVRELALRHALLRDVAVLVILTAEILIFRHASPGVQQTCKTLKDNKHSRVPYRAITQYVATNPTRTRNPYRTTSGFSCGAARAIKPRTTDVRNRQQATGPPESVPIRSSMTVHALHRNRQRYKVAANRLIGK